jgi:hypothetical protein
MEPSDFRRGVAASAGSPRLLDFSFPTRCLQSPRGACRLHTSAASPTVAGFVKSGRLAAPTLCNEAESSSIALRLAGSPHRASPWGLLLSAPVWLHVGHLFDMLITFQINREASLGLAHRKGTDEKKGMSISAVVRLFQCLSRCHDGFSPPFIPCPSAFICRKDREFPVRLSPLRSGCGSLFHSCSIPGSSSAHCFRYVRGLRGSLGW